MMVTKKELEQLNVNAIRVLAMDGVQKAKSGHPGMPMGMADAAYVLWTQFLKHNPKNPAWANRDRFILSAGHGSMLLYSLLHLTGYDLPIEQLQQFRQWGSLTPGHPEHGLTPGVETTTGPLGQGFGNGVGMALAERFLASMFNRPGHEIVDHYTYAIVSDGEMMEGISHEAASLAGHWGLGKIIYLYDDNEISIEGSTDLAFTENIPQRFQSYKWHVQEVDGHDRAAIAGAIRAAQAESAHPSLIVCHTHIGYGSPNKQDTSASHGEPLGDDEVRLTKEKLGWPTEPAFYVPAEVRDYYAGLQPGWAKAEKAWNAKLAAYKAAYPAEAAQFEQLMSGKLPDGWDKKLPTFEAGKDAATRNSSGVVMQALAEALPNLIGGSADLSPSTKTNLNKCTDIACGNYAGRNIHFGVREHGMGAILNGLALHGGIIPFGSTFLIFSDYMRPPIRLAAIMEQGVIYVFTHDSIFVGEDGPTHEPVEQFAILRAIPHLKVIRPADANETTVAWKVAIERRNGPTALLLTRQNIPTYDRTKYPSAEELRKGAYIMSEAAGGKPDIIIIATGSEVAIALEAQATLAAQGVAARVVNMPCWELFDEQPKEYRDQVLPPGVKARLAVEAGSPLGWHKYVGASGGIVGIENRYGSSAPYKTLAKEYGFTGENVVKQALAMLKKG
jgi:transketolase